MMTFELESVGSNSSSTITFVRDQNRSTVGRRDDFSVNRVSKDTCFRCKKQGHWARYCPDGPNRTPLNKAPPPTTATFLSTDGSHHPSRVSCPCGAGNCCGSSNAKRVERDEVVNAPICGCGAGPCRVSTEKSGPNAGRKFFICHIKKGQGACDFSLRLDDVVDNTTNSDADWNANSPQSTLANIDDASPISSDLVEGNLSHYDLDFDLQLMTLSGLSKSDLEMMLDLDGEEEETEDEPLRKQCKRLRNGAPKISCSSFSYGTNPENSIYESEIQASVLTYKDEIHLRQAEFENEISMAGNTLQGIETSILTHEAEIHLRQAEFEKEISMAGATSQASTSSVYSCSSASTITVVGPTQNCLVLTTVDIGTNLGIHIQGWLGRLIFSPSRGLVIPLPKPFFCCVFPCFDPVKDVQIKHGFNSGGKKPSPLPPTDDFPPLTAVFSDPSDRQMETTSTSSVMELSVLEAFSKAATTLQNKLLSLLLQSTDHHHLASMAGEAAATFAALDLLRVDYCPFRDRVNELISLASLFSEIDQTMEVERGLVDVCIQEKNEFEELSRAHAEAEAKLEAGRDRLQRLKAEANRLRHSLFETEAEVFCCEEENREITNRFELKSREMKDSGERVRRSAGVLEVFRRREAEREVAKAAYEKARDMLHGQ